MRKYTWGTRITPLAVIARSPCDEAIQGPRDAASGLLRFARNDGVGSFNSSRSVGGWCGTRNDGIFRSIYEGLLSRYGSRPYAFAPQEIIMTASTSPAPRARTCLGVLLAAGEGVRMRSLRAKPLHEVAGRSMLAHAMKALAGAGAERIAVVVGPGCGRGRRRGAAAWVGRRNPCSGGAARHRARRARREVVDRTRLGRHSRDLRRRAVASRRNSARLARRSGRGGRARRARLRGRRSRRLWPTRRARRRAGRDPRAEGCEPSRTRDPPLQRRAARDLGRAGARMARSRARRQRRARVLSDRPRRDRRRQGACRHRAARRRGRGHGRERPRPARARRGRDAAAAAHRGDAGGARR